MNPATQVAATIVTSEPVVIGLFYLLVAGVTIIACYRLADTFGKHKHHLSFRRAKRGASVKDILQCAF